jgi:hypothetical protein
MLSFCGLPSYFPPFGFFEKREAVRFPANEWNETVRFLASLSQPIYQLNFYQTVISSLRASVVRHQTKAETGRKP